MELQTQHVLPGVLGSLFLYAASFKISSSLPLRRTLVELGIPWGMASVIARLIPVIEVVLALSVLGLASSRSAAVLVLLTAVGIGSAGVVALRKDDPIACSCFSAYSGGVLGRRQVASAMLLVAAAIALLRSDPQFTARQSLLWITLASFAGIVAHMLASASDIARLVGYRRATHFTYPS